MQNYKRGGKAVTRSVAKEKKRMYSQEQYDTARNYMTKPMADKKLRDHYGISNADYKRFMGGIGGSRGTAQKVSGGKGATAPGKIGPRKPKKGKMKY